MFLALQCAHCRRGCGSQHQYHSTDFLGNKPQRQKQQSQHQRNKKQFDKADIIHPWISHRMKHICLCHADSGGNHCHRGVQVRDISKSGGNQGRQRNPEEKQQQSDDNPDHRRGTKLFHQRFLIGFPGQHHNSVGPGETEEHRKKSGGIKHALRTKEGTCQRDSHKATVAVNRRKAFDFRLPSRFFPDHKGDNGNCKNIRNRRQKKRPQEVDYQSGLILHLCVSIYHQHRGDNFQNEVGKLFSPLFVYDFRPICKHTHKIQKQHQNCLFKNN